MKTLIIIVDDNVETGLLVKKYLHNEEEKVKALYYQNPWSAKEYLLNSSPEDYNIYMIVDIMLQDINGLDFIRDIKAKFPHINFCILTSVNDERTIDKAFKLGISEYILKNKTIYEITDKIQKLILNDVNPSPEYIEIYRVSDVVNHYKIKSRDKGKIILHAKDELPTKALINLGFAKGEHKLYRVEKCDLTDDGVLITCRDYREIF